MEQKEKPIERYQQLQEYGKWLLSQFENQGVSISVVGTNGLHVKGKITIEQKELIRLWKRQLIEALSPKCSNCTLPLQLINDRELWFCPFGCQSLEVEN